MSNPTTPFSWQMPTSTDLVTDLPADFEVFGQAVATSMADLLGGTTGQILSKASNTDMDFTWIANDQGDITAVNVTSPITGGGSAGAVTVGIQDASTSQKGAVQLSDSTSTTSSVLAATPTAVKSSYDLAAAAIPKSTVTTNGDLIYGTGSGTVSRLGVGSTGQVLTVASGVPAWASPAGGGKVLQVVAGYTTTTATNTTGTPANTNLTATITPTSSTSKILVIVNQTGASKTNDTSIGMNLLRGTTAIQNVFYMGYTGTALRLDFGDIGMMYLDSPATTSATTYKTQFFSQVSVATVSVQQNNGTSSIILMEIGA